MAYWDDIVRLYFKQDFLKGGWTGEWIVNLVDIVGCYHHGQYLKSKSGGLMWYFLVVDYI